MNIPDINNYNVLNIRMKYTGGVVVYFNERKVARFNLVKNFNSETMSVIAYSSDAYSKFHIIMSRAQAVTGNNIIAFEIHRPNGQSSSNPVTFDATGIFGVNECSIVIDTYSLIDGSEAFQCNLEDLLDLNPTILILNGL